MKATAADTVWRALADPTRRRLLDFLAQGPRTTGDLVARVPELSRTGVMKHLDVLEAAGLVVVRREGRVRWNYLNPVPIQRVCERWIQPHLRHISGALSRLKHQSERPRRDKE